MGACKMKELMAAPKKIHIETMLNLYRSGKTSSEIGEMFGVGGRAVTKQLNKLNEPIRTQKIEAPSKEKLTELIATMTNGAIALKYNVSLPTVAKWLRTHCLLEWEAFDVNSIFYTRNSKPRADRFNEDFIRSIGHWEEFQKSTKDFTEEYSIREKIQAIKAGLIETPKCIECGKNTHWKDGRFSDYCSQICSFHSKERANKISKAHLSRDHIESDKKRKATMLEKYGYETNSQRPECKPNLEKSVLTREVLEKLKDPHYLTNEYITKERNASDIASDLGVWYGTVLYHLRKNDFDIRQTSNYSSYEVDLRNVIKELNVDFIQNDQTFIGMELDIYIPSKKVAIEFNGLWWHCELHKSRSYHLEKTKRCAKKGVQLIHIFEDEWINKREQFIDFIRSKLGIFERRIPARKCKFMKINKQYEFFKENHMQGSPQTSIHTFGLFYEEELIGCVSYGYHHRGGNILVLNRLAFKRNVQIIGGVSKLVGNSLKTMNVPVISWSDNRWTQGNIYKNTGFIMEAEYGPDYSYISKSKIIRHPKQMMQKKKIGCPENMTEKEFCLSKGLYRIYDCGKKKWVWYPEK